MERVSTQNHDIPDRRFCKLYHYSISSHSLRAYNNYQDDLLYPMVFEPGQGWSYSVGFDWIGHLVSSADISIQEHARRQN
jgi:hypothetical protein